MSKSPKNPAEKRAPRVLSAERIRSLAAAEFAAGTSLPEAYRRIDKKAKRPTVALVANVYWRLTGEASPIEGKTPRARVAALVRRRKAGVRFEVLAASYGAAVGRPSNVAEVKRLLASGGLDPETSYSGRGTRRSAAGEAARTVVAQ